MAPRAGFQIARKLLSERVAQTSNELDTPSDTPRIHALRSGVFARACDAGKRIKTKQVHRYRPDVYGFSAGNIVDVPMRLVRRTWTRSAATGFQHEVLTPG